MDLIWCGFMMVLSLFFVVLFFKVVSSVGIFFFGFF